MLFLKRKKLLNIFKYETLKNKVISKSDPCSLQLAADSNNMYSLFCTIDKHKKLSIPDSFLCLFNSDNLTISCNLGYLQHLEKHDTQKIPPQKRVFEVKSESGS